MNVGAGLRQTVVQLGDAVQGAAVFNYRLHSGASLRFIQQTTI